MTFAFSTKRLCVSEYMVRQCSTDSSGLLRAIVDILKPEVVEHLPPYFHNIDSTVLAQAWLDRMLQDSRLFLVERQNGGVVGFIFASTGHPDQSHIGYVLAETCWGKGLASEMLCAFVDEMRTEAHWQRLLAGVDRSNTASLKVLEKCGFTRREIDESGMIFYQYLL